jgi:hypothetical protein
VTLLSREKRRKGIEPAARLFGAGFSAHNENGIIQVVPAH